MKSVKGMENSVVFRLINLPVRHPWLVTMGALVVTLALAAGAGRLTFSDDIRVFFSKDNPQLLAYEALENTYTKSNSVLFVIAPKDGPRDGKVFTRETLASIHWLTNAAWKVPFSRRVDSITNFQHSYAEKDDLVVEDLVLDPKKLLDADLKRIRGVALAEPLLKNRLISASGDVTGVNVPIILPGKDPLTEQPLVAAYVRKLAAKAQADNPNLKIHLTGLIMINNALAEAGYSDMQTLIPAMLLAVLVVLGILLRNVSGVFVTLLVILFSIFAALGTAGWFKIVLSPPVISAANIIMTLAVADSIHLLVTFLHNMRQNMTRQDAMVESLKINFMPIFLTSFTTMLGFMSMNFSESPPFRDLGNIVAMGVVAAWALSMFLLPALMMILPVRASGRELAGGEFMDRFAGFVIANRKKLMGGMVLVVLVLLAFVPRNTLNDEFVKYFSKDLPFRVATDFSIENLTGFEFIEYSMESGEAGGIHHPDYLHNVDAFATWLRGQPEVRHVFTITDIIKRLSQNLHQNDAAWYRLPDNRELAAQYLLLYEMSLPFGLDLTDRINVDKSATRVTVSLTSISTNGMLALERRATQWMKKNMPAKAVGVGTGQSLMFAHIGSRNIRSLLGGTVIALVLISIMLIFAFRSFKFGLLSLVPNLAPAAMAFGLWGMTVGEVGLALSVVVGMTLGIVVDDTIHFMSKFLYAARDKDMSAEDATRYAFQHVGTAMCVTTLVLVCGFAVLTLSDFELNAGMGLLSAVTIVMALVADFLLLPPLLMLVKGKGGAPANASNP